MRKYQPIWNQLKTHRKATLIAPTADHARIVQAVRKERSKDLGHKLIMAEKNITLSLKVSSADKTLDFILEEIHPITVDDL